MSLLLIFVGASSGVAPIVPEVSSGVERLSLGVYEDSTKAVMLADWSARAFGVSFDTDNHGFGYLTATIPMTLDEAFRYYDNLQFAHVELGNGAAIAFEGRLEDPAYRGGALTIGAYGYWRAMTDLPYTAAWVTGSNTRDWRIMTEDLVSTRTPAKYHMENGDGRIYISLRKNETYADGVDGGNYYLEVPHNGERDWVEVTFTYDVTLPTNWRFVTSTWDTGATFTNGVEDDTITGNGASQTGTKTVTLTADNQILSFGIYNNTGGAYNNTNETDDWYAKITAISARTTSSNTVYADEIVDALVAFVNGVNSTQLSSSTALVGAPAVAINEAVYEDERPNRIIDALAELGDGSESWEAGVWEGQKLHFRARAGNAWYVDIADLTIDATADSLANSVYAVYRNASGFTQRTAVSADAASVSKYGVTRRDFVRADTGDSTEAGNWRDTHLDDSKDITPRTMLITRKIYTASGGLAPAWLIRAGDTLTIRNLLPGAGGVVDKIRTMRLVRTRYDVDTDTVSLYPGAELPGLDLLVAQNTAK